MSSPLLIVSKGSTQYRQWRILSWGYAVALAVLVPLVLQPFQIGRMNQSLVFVVAVLAVNLVVGFNGILALGHSAFMGIGAFVAASMVQDELWDYWMVIPLVLVVGFAVGLIIGLPALRVKGLYLALITIAQAAVFPSVLKIDELGIAERTGGPNGRRVEEEVDRQAEGFSSWFEWLPGVDGTRGSAAYRYWILLLITVLAIALVRNIIRSRPGRAVLAIRDNEAGAAVYGVNLPLYKTVNFALSASLGSLAGLMWCLDKGFVGEQDFTFILAIDLIIGLVIGGVGTLQGSVLGGLFVVWVRDFTKRLPVIPLGFYELSGDGPLSAAIFGIILILFTFFAPGGIASMITAVQKRIIQVVPLTPAGNPVTPLERLDPGPSSVRSAWALRLAVIGPVLLVVGWILMNVDNLIVGTFAFMARFAIVLLAPIVVFVAMNELRAAKAGLRGDNAAQVSAQAKMAGVLGVLSFAYIKTFALNVALRAHHVGHLARKASLEVDGRARPAIPVLNEAAKSEGFEGAAVEFCATNPSGDFNGNQISDLCEIAGEAAEAADTPVGFWLVGWSTQSTLAMVLSIIAFVGTIFVGLRYFVFSAFSAEKPEAPSEPRSEDANASA
ncbi:branched-chain amino acid ABC transporter permease [Candidatus Poriferisodalis sp.]|uniref:branched-chain amino acid ABC transporter permease n=1 Tax=Candidatus Poriferisodalis sp. TaxID=3101277 RepID=UPI003B015322